MAVHSMWRCTLTLHCSLNLLGKFIWTVCFLVYIFHYFLRILINSFQLKWTSEESSLAKDHYWYIKLILLISRPVTCLSNLAYGRGKWEHNRVNFSYWKRMFWMFFSDGFQYCDCKSRFSYTLYVLLACKSFFVCLFTDIWLHSACIHIFILDARRRGSTAFYNPQVQRESFCLQQAGKASRKHASPTCFWQGACADLTHLLATYAKCS